MCFVYSSVVSFSNEVVLVATLADQLTNISDGLRSSVGIGLSLNEEVTDNRLHNLLIIIIEVCPLKNILNYC